VNNNRRRRLWIEAVVVVTKMNSSGAKRSGPPKHQNKYAWKPNAGRKINETVRNTTNLTSFRSNRLIIINKNSILNTIDVFVINMHRKLEEDSGPSLRSLGCALVARIKSNGNAVMANTSLFFSPPNGTVYFIFLTFLFKKKKVPKFFSWIALDWIVIF